MDILNANISVKDILSLITNKQKIKSLELNQALNLYLKIKANTVRTGTLEFYKESISNSIKLLNNLKCYETKQINQDVIDTFTSKLLLNNLKNVSVNKKLKNLKYMLKTLNEYDLIDFPDFKIKRLKEEETKIEIVNNNDLKKVISYLPSLNHTQQLIILLLISTGIRRNELVHIQIENIDLNNNSIYLSFTKTGKPRFCFISEDLKSLLIKQIELASKKKSIFLFPKGTSHLSADAITSFFEKLKNKLGLKAFSPHKLRHLYATQLLKNGADIMAVKELLGHSSLKITQKYLDYTKDDLKDYNNKFNPLKDLLKS